MSLNRQSLLTGLVFFVVSFIIRALMGGLAEHGVLRLALEIALATVVFLVLMHFANRFMSGR